ncbi:MAG: adenosylmethionine decarboxylase [Alphaproteobacteria bacterium]|nr:adenosylmethionine decarboxylase [Alphaproteobacteria bacterium]
MLREGLALAKKLAVVQLPSAVDTDTSHFVAKDGLRYAGTHLLIDIWQAERLDDLSHVETTLRDAVAAVGATLLRIDLHHFSENGGISGVAVLAESHMSIHTWPECGYAALDVFVCGGCDAYKAIPVLRAAFRPRDVRVSEVKRGLVI